MSVLRNLNIHKSNAIREGVKIVRNVLATNDSTVNGLTTTELYQLALRQPIPSGYKGDPRLSSDVYRASLSAPPPHNDHPVRSKSFLKRSILRALEGSDEIVKTMIQREVASPASVPRQGKKGKPIPAALNTKETADGSSANPVLVKTWVWKTQPQKVTQPFVMKVSEPLGAAVGTGEDWSHLNKRRQRTRRGKVQRDLATVKQLRAQKREATLAS